VVHQVLKHYRKLWIGGRGKPSNPCHDEGLKSRHFVFFDLSYLNPGDKEIQGLAHSPTANLSGQDVWDTNL
jgi:hypothetical protein